jgi:hypothetical protein
MYIKKIKTIQKCFKGYMIRKLHIIPIKIFKNFLKRLRLISNRKFFAPFINEIFAKVARRKALQRINGLKVIKNIFENIITKQKGYFFRKFKTYLSNKMNHSAMIIQNKYRDYLIRKITIIKLTSMKKIYEILNKNIMRKNYVRFKIRTREYIREKAIKRNLYLDIYERAIIKIIYYIKKRNYYLNFQNSNMYHLIYSTKLKNISLKLNRITNARSNIINNINAKNKIQKISKKQEDTSLILPSTISNISESVYNTKNKLNSSKISSKIHNNKISHNIPGISPYLSVTEKLKNKYINNKNNNLKIYSKTGSETPNHLKDQNKNLNLPQKVNIITSLDEDIIKNDISKSYSLKSEEINFTEEIIDKQLPNKVKIELQKSLNKNLKLGCFFNKLKFKIKQYVFYYLKFLFFNTESNFLLNDISKYGEADEEISKDNLENINFKTVKDNIERKEKLKKDILENESDNQSGNYNTLKFNSKFFNI